MNSNPFFKQESTGFSTEFLTNEIIMWGRARGIIKHSNSDAQASKTLEEVEELRTHAAQLKFLREFVTPEIMRAALDAKVAERMGDVLNKIEADLLDKLVDDYGDVFVTLVMGAEIEGIDVRAAIASAYNEIKDRKGEMRADGKFHKE
jgi:NTP pyrophosphatase (non-canonical NTP hydrolase)